MARYRHSASCTSVDTDESEVDLYAVVEGRARSKPSTSSRLEEELDDLERKGRAAIKHRNVEWRSHSRRLDGRGTENDLVVPHTEDALLHRVIVSINSRSNNNNSNRNPTCHAHRQRQQRPSTTDSKSPRTTEADRGVLQLSLKHSRRDMAVVTPNATAAVLQKHRTFIKDEDFHHKPSGVMGNGGRRETVRPRSLSTSESSSRAIMMKKHGLVSKSHSNFEAATKYNNTHSATRRDHAPRQRSMSFTTKSQYQSTKDTSHCPPNIHLATTTTTKSIASSGVQKSVVPQVTPNRGFFIGTFIGRHSKQSPDGRRKQQQWKTDKEKAYINSLFQK